MDVVAHARPEQISWGPVAACVVTMFASGLSLLRSELGSAFTSCVVSKLRGYAWWVTAGGRFAFGYLAQGVNMTEHLGPSARGVVDVPPVFAFATLPSLCFVAALVRTLYYLGFVQAFLAGIDRHVVGLGFNSYEVIIALVSVLNGPMESMLLLHPYLLTMPGSSLHCVFALEWSTISGQLVPVYTDLGVNSTYLVSASILSVPAALAYSKLVYPESEGDSRLCNNYRSPDKTLIEAVTTGAVVGVYMIFAIVANVLTYSSLARFLDACITWTASNVGVQHLGLQWLLERAYQPVVLLMGVSWQDSRAVAQLLAIKVFLNEYVAFTALVKTADKLEARPDPPASYLTQRRAFMLDDPDIRLNK
ncbi:sodium/nucleoside cotransporter 1-like [Haemaphysalis longicornis]